MSDPPSSPQTREPDTADPPPPATTLDRDPPAPSTSRFATISTPAVTFPPASQSILAAPPVARSSSTQSSHSISSTNLDAHVYGIALVGFDHALGPNVEFLYPQSLEENRELKDELPFLALPDGAHAVRQRLALFLSRARIDETFSCADCCSETKTTLISTCICQTCSPRPPPPIQQLLRTRFRLAERSTRRCSESLATAKSWRTNCSTKGRKSREARCRRRLSF